MKKVSFMVLTIFLFCSGIYAQGSLSPFNAVGTVSTESRFSAGMYGSDVDDFIHPNFRDTEIGTFFFLGGFPGKEGAPEESDIGAIINDDYQISFGVGKTMRRGYLGLYYNGSIFDGSTYKYEKVKQTDMAYYNKIALLYAAGNMGIRLDLITDPFRVVTNDTANSEYTSTSGFRTALSYGTFLRETPIWARFGYRFPDKETTKSGGSTVEKTENGQMGIELGGEFYLSEATTWVSELYFLLNGQEERTGPNKYEKGGGLAFLWYNQLQQEYLITDDVTFKVAPNFIYLLQSESNDYKDNNVTRNPPSDTRNEFAAGLDFGVKYTYQKISLYSGVGLQIFDIARISEVQNKNATSDYKSSTAWEYDGIVWSDPSSNGYVSFGLTFTPVENLVFGTGLQTGVPTVNLKTMEIKSYNPPNNDGTYPGNSFGNTTLQVTASYKF